MRDQDYYELTSDDAYTTDDSGYINDTEAHAYSHDAQNDDVELFLENQTSDYIAGFESKRKNRSDRSVKPERAPGGFDDYAASPPVEDSWRPAPPPNFEDDEEFMTQLANIRRDRPRRREQNPMPKPAVRVNSERRRRLHSPEELHETHEAQEHEVDTGYVQLPLEDEDYSTFRPRYDGPDIMAPTTGTRVKEPRPRGTVPTHRREQDNTDGTDTGNPLRYLLAIVFVGVLGLMAFLAMNNRNLRRDVEYYQAQIASMDDSTVALALMTVELEGYREDLRYYRGQVEGGRGQYNGAQVAESYVPGADYTQGYEQPGDEPYEGPAETYPPPGRPSDETPTQEAPPPPPPAPEPVIHIVQSGEVLSRIANLHFGSSTQHYVNLIAAANNLTDPGNIRIGQELVIPPRE